MLAVRPRAFSRAQMGRRSFSKVVEQTPVCIIGSGPAAHTAAIYASRAELEPIIFEGDMANGIAGRVSCDHIFHTNQMIKQPAFPCSRWTTHDDNRRRELSWLSGWYYGVTPFPDQLVWISL